MATSRFRKCDVFLSPDAAPRSFRLPNLGDDAHNGNVKRIVDSQRSSLSFGTGRTGLVSAAVNLRD